MCSDTNRTCSDTKRMCSITKNCNARLKRHLDAQSNQKDAMASIYERPPFYKGEKKRDNNNTLSEVYKLQSNNPQNKSRVEIHKDNDGYSIEFTVDKTISEFNKVAEKCVLTWVNSFTEFKNVLQGQHRTAWKQMLHEHFLEPVNAMRPVPSAQDRISVENFCQAIQLFLQRTLSKMKPRDRQYIYLQPGGDYIFKKVLMTKLHLQEGVDDETNQSSLQVQRDASISQSSSGRGHARTQQHTQS